MMKRTMMALAAVPVAALLAGGGVAVAQATGAPAHPAVVQQTGVHHPEGTQHAQHMRTGQVTRVVKVPVCRDGDHTRDRVRDRSCDRDHAAQQQGSGMMAHHGEDHGAGHSEDAGDE